MVDYGEGDVGICLILIQDDTGPEAVNCEGFAMKLSLLFGLETYFKYHLP